jgi:hypothetical protein
MIGKTFQVLSSYDGDSGVYYKINGYTIPHYAVRKIVDFNDIEKSESQEIAEEEVTVKLSRADYNKLIELLNNEQKKD